MTHFPMALSHLLWTLISGPELFAASCVSSGVLPHSFTDESVGVTPVHREIQPALSHCVEEPSISAAPDPYRGPLFEGGAEFVANLKSLPSGKAGFIGQSQS